MDAEDNNNASNETAEAVEQHSSLFYEKLNDILSVKDNTAYPMSEELFNRKVDCVKQLQGGAAPVTLRNKGFPQAYDWANKYDIIHIGSKDTLVYKAVADEEGNLPPLDNYKRVSSQNSCFNDERSVHIENGCHQ